MISVKEETKAWCELGCDVIARIVVMDAASVGNILSCLVFFGIKH